MKFFFAIFFSFLSLLQAEKQTLPIAYYLDITNYTWKGPAQITLENKKITQISFVNPPKNQKIYYITPSFCDAQVTLSLNGLGGVNDRSGISEILQVYLKHGITHILSTFDPPWVEEIYKELLKRNSKLPKVFFSPKPIIFPTKEYPDLPIEIYFSQPNLQEIQKEVYNQSKLNLPMLLRY
jgi:hypothetical protein